MSKNIYSYDIFLEVKQNNNFVIDTTLKESLETINKIIDNNYGISYHEKNNKHKNKNKNLKFDNNSELWRSQKTSPCIS